LTPPRGRAKFTGPLGIADMAKPIDEKIASARKRVTNARRILEQNRKRLTDPRHRGIVEPSYLKTLETSLRLFEDELIRLVEEKVSRRD
jgi:hypothetical protein